MEELTEFGVDLFAEELPAMEQLGRLSDIVHSGEKSQIDFNEQLEDNMSKTGQKAYLAVGIGLYIVGRNSEAIEKLGKVNDCKEKFIYLAFALRQLGRFDESLENLDKSLKHGADTLSITLEKAEAYRQTGDLEAAGRELGSCANFEAVSAEYHYQLGRLQEAQGLYEQATDNYKTALELSPNHQQALFHLAYRCDLQGDEDAAIDYYKQIGLNSPIRINSLLNLAVLYEDKAEYDKASQCIDKILKFHPNHQRAILFKKDIESSKTMFFDEDKEEKRDRKTQILETPLSDFELSVRSRNCFRRMGITKLGDLMKITEAELLSYKNFGETSLSEIKVILESKGLPLGGDLEGKMAGSEQVTEADAEEDEKQTLLNKSVGELNLSVRAQKCIQKLSVKTLDELTGKTDAELLGCKNFGVTSLNEIKNALDGLGLSLRTLE